MANYLVTGGCGFIGSHLVDRLIADGHRVLILDDLSTGKLANIDTDSEACQLVVGDVSDTALVKECMHGMDGCFHLAAVSSVQQSNEEWVRTHEVNQLGTINVLEAARARKSPVVYASSAAVYGDNADTPLKERSTGRPLTAYGADKLGSELHATVASLVHGVPTTGLRFFNVYGPRQDPSSPYSGVISIFMTKALLNAPAVIFGDGNQSRDFIYVQDVVRANLLAATIQGAAGQVINIGSGKSVAINQLWEKICALSGRNLEPEYAPQRPGDIVESVAGIESAGACLGFECEVPFEKGLSAKSDVSLAIYNKFRASGIEIPFPQRDVHIKTLPDNTHGEPRADS